MLVIRCYTHFEVYVFILKKLSLCFVIVVLIFIYLFIYLFALMGFCWFWGVVFIPEDGTDFFDFCFLANLLIWVFLITDSGLIYSCKVIKLMNLILPRLSMDNPSIKISSFLIIRKKKCSITTTLCLSTALLLEFIIFKRFWTVCAVHEFGVPEPVL